MSTFKPSEYGASWWDTAKSYDPTGLVAKAEVAVATSLPPSVAVAAGTSLSPSAYTAVPAAAKATPKTTVEAYDQAMYWLDFAGKRAAYDQKASAVGQLQAAFNVLSSERAKVDPSWTTAAGLACNALGYGCPTKARAEVLQYAANVLQSSQLGQSDKDTILPIIESARRSVLIQQALPVIVAAGIGAVAGRWLYRRYK